MDIVLVSSSGLLFGLVIQQIFDKFILKKILHSPLVQQVLNVTMGLTARQATDIMINISKEIGILAANILILVANLAKELLILFKHVFIVVKATVNMLYIILSTVNIGIQKVFDISHLFSRFLTRPSVVYTFWGTIFIIFAAGFVIEKMKMKLIAQRSCKTSDHSGKEEQAAQPGNCQLLSSTPKELQEDQSAE